MDKCNRCKGEAHHTHHKDHNHGNNVETNLERLCTLCHAKEHGIEPKISELRMLVTYYERVQKARVTIGNTLKSFSRIEIDPPDALVGLHEDLRELESKYGGQLKQYWDDNPSDTYDWIISIKGIRHVISSKILARIDFDNTPSVASLWAYAGLSPDSKKAKGKKANWNQNLKRDCFQLVDSFIKQRTPRYRDVYDREKAKQLNNDIQLGHAHNRAIRKVAKVFLQDLFLQQRGSDR